MSVTLKELFPMIRTREEIQQEINANTILKKTFDNWQPEHQEEFLDFCSGAHGVKVLYDGFFKEIFNPESVPERLNHFLTLLLNQKVTIISILPNDSVRLAEESSLLITDIVVELADGSLVNLEIQKIGYHFPGTRSACYSADLLLRQYKRVRNKKKKKFNYRDVKSVYTIVLFEQSTGEFHQFPNEYLHFFRQESNTGLKLNLLQEYCFIPLDIFRKSIQNKGIQNERDAWLAFLCEDSPDIIMEIIRKYPKFKSMYEHVYSICQNMEDVMGLFSEELRELDRNTVQYMIDEMQEDIDQKNIRLKELELHVQNQENLLKQRDNRLKQQENLLKEQGKQLQLLKEQLSAMEKKMQETVK